MRRYPKERSQGTYGLRRWRNLPFLLKPPRTERVVVEKRKTNKKRVPKFLRAESNRREVINF